MALSKGFRIFEKKTPNHSIILEHRARTNEALLFESQAIAVLCKKSAIHANDCVVVVAFFSFFSAHCLFPFDNILAFISWNNGWIDDYKYKMIMTETSFYTHSSNEIGQILFLSSRFECVMRLRYVFNVNVRPHLR